MYRSMHLRHLEKAEHHISRGEQQVSAQERRIEDLERHGHNTTLARLLLETFLRTQTQFVEHRDQARRALSRLD